MMEKVKDRFARTFARISIVGIFLLIVIDLLLVGAMIGKKKAEREFQEIPVSDIQIMDSTFKFDSTYLDRYGHMRIRIQVIKQEE